jgi:hypothetical protein
LVLRAWQEQQFLSLVWRLVLVLRLVLAPVREQAWERELAMVSVQVV